MFIHIYAIFTSYYYALGQKVPVSIEFKMSYVKKMSRPRSRLRFEFLKIDMKQVELPPILNQHNRS